MSRKEADTTASPTSGWWVTPRRSHDDDVAAENLHDSLHGQFHTVSSTLYHSHPPPSPPPRRGRRDVEDGSLFPGRLRVRVAFRLRSGQILLLLRGAFPLLIFHVVSGPSSRFKFQWNKIHPLWQRFCEILVVTYQLDSQSRPGC